MRPRIHGVRLSVAYSTCSIGSAQCYGCIVYGPSVIALFCHKNANGIKPCVPFFVFLPPCVHIHGHCKQSREGSICRALYTALH